MLTIQQFDPDAVILDPEALARRLRLPRREILAGRARELAEQVAALAEPRAAYATLPVGSPASDHALVGGARLESRLLARKLEAVERVFPYVVTLGEPLDDAIRTTPDLLDQYCLDLAANLALVQVQRILQHAVAGTTAAPHLSSLSPGSLPDWPIQEQRKVFGLLGDVQRAVGVHLTDSFLMLPRKSLSGLFFPTAEAFSACQLCPRGNCPSRRAPYAPETDPHGA